MFRFLKEPSCLTLRHSTRGSTHHTKAHQSLAKSTSLGECLGVIGVEFVWALCGFLKFAFIQCTLDRFVPSQRPCTHYIAALHRLDGCMQAGVDGCSIQMVASARCSLYPMLPYYDDCTSLMVAVFRWLHQLDARYIQCCHIMMIAPA
jgi:hypothetical protein